MCTGAVTEETVTTLYGEMLAQQGAILGAYCDPIPGALDALAALRREGVRIGSTTGYGKEAMAVVAPAAAQRGFVPDDVGAYHAHTRTRTHALTHPHTQTRTYGQPMQWRTPHTHHPPLAVCVSDVPAGRPAPWMAQLSAQRLGVYPPWRCVKVDDTEAGVREGRNAGMWAVGVALTGNEVGLSQAAVAALPADVRAARVAAARARLEAAGAHCVVDSIAELPTVVATLNARLRKGLRPDCAHSS